MGLLSPWFLLGLTALAVPVLVHLVQRETRRVVPFPSLMFLRKIAQPTAQRRRVRHWPLLLVRLLALALLVAAFARPYLHGGLPGLTTGARDVVVLLDRSFSMQTGTRWTRAQAAVTAQADRLGAGDRLTLIGFAAGAEVLLEASGDAAQVRDTVARLRPGHETTRFAPALGLAAGLLGASPRPVRELVVVSDFPQAAWTPGDGVRLPDDTVVTPVPVTDGEPPANVSLLPLSLARSRFGERERVTVTASLMNRSAAATEVPVTLEADERAVDTVRVRVDGQTAARATFAPLTLPERETRLRVRVPDDALGDDNAVFAVAAPSRPLPVTVVTGAGRTPSAYLRNALAAGGMPGFAVTTVGVAQLSAEAVATAAAVVADDVALTSAHVEMLAAVAARGGSVLLLAGPGAQWPVADALPASTEAFVDRSAAGGGRMAGVALAHPLFAPFRSLRGGDFGSVRIYGYRRLRAAPEARVLARVDDGAPLLLERIVGAGRIYVWASSVDVAWTDLPLRPVFLPLMHQLVQAGRTDGDGATALTVGQVISAEALGLTAPITALSPSGRRLSGASPESAGLVPDEPGIYIVRSAGGPEAAARLVAVNVDAAEADPAALDPAAWASRLAPTSTAGAPSAPAAAAGTSTRDTAAQMVPPVVQEQRQRVWWYLLAAGMLLLGVETVMVRRLTPGPTGTGGQ